MSPRGIHTPSPLQRTWTTWLSKGSRLRNEAQVSGASLVSNRASKRKGPAVIFKSAMGRASYRRAGLRRRALPNAGNRGEANSKDGEGRQCRFGEQHFPIKATNR